MSDCCHLSSEQKLTILISQLTPLNHLYLGSAAVLDSFQTQVRSHLSAEGKLALELDVFYLLSQCQQPVEAPV